MNGNNRRVDDYAIQKPNCSQDRTEVEGGDSRHPKHMKPRELDTYSKEILDFIGEILSSGSSPTDFHDGLMNNLSLIDDNLKNTIISASR